MSDSVRPHRWQPTRLPRPWDSPGKNTGVGCHFLLQCMKAKSETEVAQSCPTLSDPMDCSLPGSSIHGIFQARILEWVTMPSFRGYSWPRDRTHDSYISGLAGRFFTTEPPGKPLISRLATYWVLKHIFIKLVLLTILLCGCTSHPSDIFPFSTPCLFQLVCISPPCSTKCPAGPRKASNCSMKTSK